MFTVPLILMSELSAVRWLAAGCRVLPRVHAPAHLETLPVRRRMRTVLLPPVSASSLFIAPTSEAACKCTAARCSGTIADACFPAGPPACTLIYRGVQCVEERGDLASIWVLCARRCCMQSLAVHATVATDDLWHKYAAGWCPRCARCHLAPHMPAARMTARTLARADTGLPTFR